MKGGDALFAVMPSLHAEGKHKASQTHTAIFIIDIFY